MSWPWDEIGLMAGCLLIGWLSTYHRFEIRRWTYPIGMLTQGFWLWTTVKHGQWVIFGGSIVFVFIYARGVYVHWWKGVE